MKTRPNKKNKKTPQKQNKYPITTSTKKTNTKKQKNKKQNKKQKAKNKINKAKSLNKTKNKTKESKQLLDINEKPITKLKIKKKNWTKAIPILTLTSAEIKRGAFCGV